MSPSGVNVCKLYEQSEFKQNLMKHSFSLSSNIITSELYSFLTVWPLTVNCLHWNYATCGHG